MRGSSLIRRAGQYEPQMRTVDPTGEDPVAPVTRKIQITRAISYPAWYVQAETP